MLSDIKKDVVSSCKDLGFVTEKSLLGASIRYSFLFTVFPFL